jgi:hypothetical protein
MAIKGKGRTRTRKMVAAPPRPQMVVRKKPILARRSTWVVVGLVVLAAVALGAVKWVRDRQASSLLTREQTAIQDLAQRVTGLFPADQTTPQGTNQTTVFPSLAQTLDKIDKGTMTAKAARTAARSVADQAGKAADGMQKLSLKSITDDFTVGVTPQLTAKGMTSSVLNVAQDEMVKSFQLYQSIGGLMVAAVAQPRGPERTAIIREATRDQTIAADLFNRGYSTLVQIESILGVAQVSGLTPSQTP